MATVNEKMTGLADAVRAKTGGTAELSIDGMTTALNNIPNKTSSDLIVNGATVTVPAGNYKTAASKSVSTVTRADTTMSVTADDTNDKLTITASNNQGAGYTSGGNKTATTTITLSASGANVTASDGSKSVTKSVATATRAGTSITTAADSTNAKLTLTATNNQNTGYVTADTSKNTATKTVTLTASGATVTATDNSSTPVKVSKSVATATRASTSLSSSKDATNNTLIFTASNPQTTGYVTADTSKNTATKTVSISASGKTVTATDGTNSISKDVASGSAATPPTTITANPSLATTLTSGKGYKMSVSKTQSVTPTVSAGYVNSGTAGNVTVSGEAYVPQSSTGDATASTTDTATKTIGYGQQTTIGAGYYPSARIIRNGVSAYSGTTSITPSTSAKTFYTSGKYIDSNLTVEAIPSEYKDTTIASNEAATAEEIVMNKYAYVNGEKIRGTMYDYGAQTYELSPGATYVIP